MGASVKIAKSEKRWADKLRSAEAEARYREECLVEEFADVQEDDALLALGARVAARSLTDASNRKLIARMSAQHAAATEEAVKATRDACDDVVRKMEAKCEDAVAKAAVEAAWVTAKAATPTDDESQMKVAKAQQMAVRAMAKHRAELTHRLGSSGQTSNLARSVASTSMRLIFG